MSKKTAVQIKAYPLNDHPATIRRSSVEPGGHGVEEQGWELLCPYAFEATWNGGSAPEDIAIRIAGRPADQPGFVQGQADGVLVFHAGYQLQVEGDGALWLRGPINHPRDGLYPLEGLVDASTVPCTAIFRWKLTRPHHTVRFAEGEPFASVVPHRCLAGRSTLEIATLESDLAAYERTFAAHGTDEADEPAESTHPSAPLTGAGRWAARLTAPPGVSCICPTHGRVALLEEAIQSFLQQDYPGPKELIVLNDYDGQTLTFDHPEVRIVNLPRRFHSLGEKYKAAAALCAHDLIFIWHDDDIYLPHRLSLSVARFDRRKGFFKGDRAWFMNDGQLSGPETNTFHGGACFARELFTAVQGYPHLGNPCDQEFEELCAQRRFGSTDPDRLKPKDVYYIYRWSGTGSYHVSALGPFGSEHDKVAKHVAAQASLGEIPLGEIALSPRWRADYLAQVRSFLEHGPVKKASGDEQEEIPFPPPFQVIPPPRAMDPAAVARLFTGSHPRRISVVLPALNESVLLRRTVEQFLATLPPESEIIVVDNGSTDGCADFLSEQALPGVRLIRTPEPLGVAGARNRGLDAALGEVVVFADAHIDVPERWWQPIVAALGRPGVGVVGPAIGVMGRPALQGACGQRIAEPNLRVEWLGWKQLDPYPVPTLGGGFMAMRRDTLAAAGGFDTGMPQWGSEDLEICLRYWLLGHEVWIVPEVTVLHYFRDRSPYRVAASSVTHNLLRVALLHFDERRIERVLCALKDRPDFGKAMAHAAVNGVWQERAALRSRRVRDDGWFFDRFHDTCAV